MAAMTQNTALDRLDIYIIIGDRLDIYIITWDRLDIYIIIWYRLDIYMIILDRLDIYIIIWDRLDTGELSELTEVRNCIYSGFWNLRMRTGKSDRTSPGI